MMTQAELDHALVTTALAVKAALMGACMLPHVGTPVEAFSTSQLIWAEDRGLLDSNALKELTGSDLPLWVRSGTSYGYGDGAGYGYSYGDGAGYGYGCVGHGYGSGYGYGDGYGCGSGSGYGFGDGYGYGYGSGYGTGSGDGDGSCRGYGESDGYGDRSQIVADALDLLRREG
jgi:hypothetical protein